MAIKEKNILSLPFNQSDEKIIWGCSPPERVHSGRFSWLPARTERYVLAGSARIVEFCLWFIYYIALNLTDIM